MEATEGKGSDARRGSYAPSECALVGARTDFIQALAETTLGFACICGEDRFLVDWEKARKGRWKKQEKRGRDRDWLRSFDLAYLFLFFFVCFFFCG